MTVNITPIRKQNKRRENELLILQAAEKVFAEAGFGGATMQLIADVAGLPKANVYYYFSTKEALYRQVVSNIFDVWLQAAESFEDASGPTEGLGAYIDDKPHTPSRQQSVGLRGDARRPHHSGLP